MHPHTLKLIFHPYNLQNDSSHIHRFCSQTLIPLDVTILSKQISHSYTTTAFQVNKIMLGNIIESDIQVIYFVQVYAASLLERELRDKKAKWSHDMWDHWIG